MKKNLTILTISMLLAGTIAWQYRMDILLSVVPNIRSTLNPIRENVPTAWPDGPTEASAPAGERPPNIILILADDMGFNDVSLYNGGAADGSVMTPNIDALAQQGVRFENGYAANAICAPSRASILTGRYSTRFGFEFTPTPDTLATIAQWTQDMEQPVLKSTIDHDVARALPPMDELEMPESEITIAEVLKDAGYYTAHIGKWHLGGGDGPQKQGFDDSLYMNGVAYLPPDHPNVVNAKREDDVVERMIWAFATYENQFNDSKSFQPDGYLTDYYTNEALKVIEKNQHRPFFLYLAHWGIHNPLQATREDYDKFSHIQDHTLRVYAAMIHSLDRSVGRITGKLEELGLGENTLIIFTSDNGGAGYIGLPDINKPYRGWKLTHFEGGTHVPFMAKWPDRIDPDSSFSEPVHHIDLFHTIAAAAGAAIPEDVKYDGVDLLPFVRRETSGKPHETLFWREGHHQSVLHNGWKLIRADRPDKPWLFNLEKDPTEQNNLAAREPEMLSKLDALLAGHNAEQADPLWPSFLDSPQLIDKHGGQAYEAGDEYIYWPN
jgi:arylsulfatase A-like enzyme